MIRLRVKEIAQQQSIGQLKLARLADMDFKTLARIYRDPYVVVSTLTLEKLAHALSVPIAELIEEIHENPGQSGPISEDNSALP